MSEKLDPYAELGVDKDASEADIKAAFRKRAKETHPDRNGGSSDHFERVKSAHLVLADPERRKKYDETGDTGERTQKTIHQRAMELVGSLIGAAIDSDKDIEHTDILDDIARFIADNVKDYERQQKKLKATLKRAEKLAKKVKRKKGGENLVSRIAETHARTLRKNIEVVTEIIDVHARAKEILADYSYEFVPLEPTGWPTPPMMSTEGIKVAGIQAAYARQFGMKGSR